MKRAVRNRLADLLLGAFDDAERRAAVGWMAKFCELTRTGGEPEVWLVDLLEEGRASVPETDDRVEAALALLIGPEGLIQLRRADTGETWAAGIPRQVEGVPWLVEPLPDVRVAMAAVCERTLIYAALVPRMGQADVDSGSTDPLRRVMAQAALCFNAGLFFEAHEHLEHHWMNQPRGPTKRFLQGIIQISVGFHHAHAGNYDGAVNQLAKGLEKTFGITGEVLGLDCDAFLPQVASRREAIQARGRAGMRPMPLAEVPRMPIR